MLTAACAAGCALVSLLLVSWDGAHPKVVKEMLAAGQLPVMQSLLDAGAAWKNLDMTEQSPQPTVTMPGHAQMLTGQPWAITGVKSNIDWAVIPEGLTLPERWKAAGASVGWTVQKPQLGAYLYGPQCPACPPPLDPRGPFWRVWQIADCAIENDAGTPHDAVLAGLSCLAQFPGRFFLFVHSQRPDAQGHLHGAGSPEYRQSLIDNDAALGILLNALPSGVQVVLTTDHGFGAKTSGGCPMNKGTDHNDCPQTWAVSWPPLLLGARLLDLAPALQP